METRRFLAAGAVALAIFGVLAGSRMLDGKVWIASEGGALPAGAYGATGASMSTVGPQTLAAGGLSNWQYLGPNNVGGPASYVTYHPSDASVLYSVSSGGDIYRSNTGGANWTYLSHVPLREARLEIPAGQSQVMYAYSNYRQLLVNDSPDVPLFKSTDGGATWTELDPLNWTRRNWLSEIRRLRSVPGQPNVLWATTAEGILKSADGGLNWNLIFSQGGGGTQCTDLEISTAASKVYAACRTPYWNVVAVDFDGIWSQITQRSGQESVTARLAMSKSDPRVMYFATFGDGSSYGGVSYLGTVSRTTDGGASWESRYNRAQLTDAVSRAVPGNFDFECDLPDFGVYTIGDNAFAVDPANPDSLWIAGFEMFRSDNGGTSFGRARARTDEVSDPALGATQGLPRDLRYSSLAFAPNYNGSSVQVMFAAGSYGIESTHNARAWAPASPNMTCATRHEPSVAWTMRNDGFAATRLVHGDALTGGEMVISGPDIDIGVSAGGGPDSWVRVTPLRQWMMGQTSLDPAEGLGRFSVSWSTGVVSWTWNAATGKWAAKQVNFDYGNPYGYQLQWHNLQYNIWFFSRYARDPNNRMHMVSGAESGVFESWDGGNVWFLVSPNVKVQAIGFRRDGTVFASTADGFVLAQTSPGARTWELRDLSGCVLVEGASCPRTAVRFNAFEQSPDPQSTGLYASANDPALAKLWYSADGRVWQPLDRPGQVGGLPARDATTSLAIDPDNPGHLYMGTDQGLYASEDNGQNWEPVETPFPLTAVSKIKFLKDGAGARKLVAFTYGRGAWSSTVAPSTTFGDVPAYSWSYDYVRRLFAAGITVGCQQVPLNYCPQQPVLREQMAVFLLRAKFGRDYVPPAAASTYWDVPSDHWGVNWIEALKAQGLTNGCSQVQPLYCPGAVVPREQMAVFLLRTKYGTAYVPPAATGQFEDVPASHWAAPWVEQLAREGVTTGCSVSPARFCPSEPVTREQLAAFLVRGFGL